MKSLIFLQGFAMGGGAFPDFERLERIAYGAGGIVVGGILVYFTVKALCPKDKW